MTFLNRFFTVAAAVLFVVAPPLRAGGSSGAPGSGRGAQAEADAKPTCCFTNPQYSGVCAVEPGKDETCASILAYLNNPQSQGKSYCGNTSIRGGWKQVECEKKSASTSRGRCRRASG